MPDSPAIQRLEAELERLAAQLAAQQHTMLTLRGELARLRVDPGGETEPVVVPVLPKPAPVLPTPPAVPVKPVSVATPFPKKDTEAFIGGNVLSKIGIAALVIGLAIFVKFAFDNDLIGPWGRIALGWGAGAGLVGLAAWLRKTYPAYSTVLLSGGLATAYFSTYTAFQFYHLLPLPITFGLMVALTGATVWQATRYNVEWIALFGLVGAYAVPLLLGGNGAAWGLFSYLSVINAGVLYLSFRRDWHWLNGAAFVVTWVIFLVFYFTGLNRTGYRATVLGFGALIFGMMYANLLARPFLRQTDGRSVVALALVLNALVFYGPGADVLPAAFLSPYRSGFTLGNALIHAVVAFTLHRRGLGNTLVFSVAQGLALVFLIGFVPVQFDGAWIPSLWALGAAVLYWLGRSRNQGLLTTFGTGLAGLSALALTVTWKGVLPTVPAFLNDALLAGLVVLAALGGMVYAAFVRFPVASGFAHTSGHLLASLLLVLGYPVLDHELTRFFASQPPTERWNALRLTVSGVFPSLYIAGLAWVVARRGVRGWRIAAVVLGSGFLLMSTALNLPEELRNSFLKNPMLNGDLLPLRFAGYAVMAGVGWSIHRLLPSVTDPKNDLRSVFTLAFHGLVLWALSQEMLTWFLWADPAQAERQLSRAVHVGWSVAWGVYSLGLIGWGFRREAKSLRLTGIGLFGVVLGKLLLFDLRGLSAGGKIVVFLSVGVLLLLTSFLYQKFRKEA